MENQNSAPSSSSVATQQRDAEQPHQQTSRLPENIEDILTDADSPINKSPPDMLYDQLSSSGIFLAKRTRKFWVNKKLNCNCFMLYARALSIAWGDDRRYWKWAKIQESSGTSIEIAELKDVCWLDVRGKLDTRKLSPGVMYGVSFHMLQMDDSVQYSGIGAVNVSLKFAGLKYKEREIDFDEMLEGTWMEIPVAEFAAPADDDGGEMEFSLWEHGGRWKRGLQVKGASIKPL